MTIRQRAILLTLAALGLTVPFILACGGPATHSSDRTPAWACPSPTPLPYGEAGPVKGYQAGNVDPTTGIPARIPIYYAEWEQEYGALGGPPFSAPTPYILKGTSYVFGQRVRVAPLFVQVSARAGAIQTDGRQLDLIDLAWVNPGDRPVSIDYGTQVRLSAVRGLDDGILSGTPWYLSSDALEAAGLPSPPSNIPPGAGRVTLPVLAPAGQPQTVDVLFARDGLAAPPSAESPTPNAALREPADSTLVVQWTNSSLQIGPPCGDPGAVTAWGDGPGAWGRDAAPIIAPPGAARVVQIALAQVGKPYILGTQGPTTFDCSGLMQWSYAQIGIAIPRTTWTQWNGLRPIRVAEAQPGDLVLFNIPGEGTTSHVGMLVGDIDGDGRWDMVHAVNPVLGVRVTSDVFGSTYYAPLIAGVRTVR
jgi:cell wall-associated NlpC family hydrolase